MRNGMSRKIKEDYDLVLRAETWATGATIHDVKGLLGHYRHAIYALNTQKGSRARRKAIRITVAVLAKTLEEFMSHGDYSRARRDNPLPDIPGE